MRLDDVYFRPYAASMIYVPRRILIRKKDESTEELGEVGFANIRSPRVLVGEPGAGKSDTAAEIQRLVNGISVHAELLASGAKVPGLGGATVIIDGVDEVLATGAVDPIATILNRLADEGVESFVLTCRAMDWHHATAEGKIVRRFRDKPCVGQLRPLNDDEMSAMVTSFSDGKLGGDEFVREADKHGATDLARNPLSLKLLLEAIAQAGWPATRQELYESASLRLTREESREHQSLNPHRPNSDRILQAAGFVFAQLLLSGQRGVAVDGQNEPYYPRAADLYGDHVTAEEINAAVGSALMRVSSAQTIEACHRTVAEFLAARWLARALRNGVSLRRVESLLYAAGTTTVPTSLRGLHAWLAVFDVSDAEVFIDADPYGVLRYGDAGSLSDDRIRRLLHSLPAYARKDPFFRSEDWNLDIGRALARDSLKDEVVALVTDKDAPYQLTTVILESVRGTTLASRMREQLRAIALDSSETYVERMRAAEAAVDGSDEAFVAALVDDLIAQKERSATRLALETMNDRPRAFSGTAIAKAFAAYYRAKDSHRVAGVGYRLVGGLTPDQLRDFLATLCPLLPKSRYASPTEFSREIEDKVLDAVEAYLKSSSDVTPEDLWQWLGRTGGRAYRDSQWSKFSAEYFDARPALRKAVQAIAFAKSKSDIWSVGFELARSASGLALKSDDVIFHLDALVAKNRKPKGWVDKWFHLFRWAATSDGSRSAAEEHARAQAKLHPELQALLDQFDNQPEPQWQIEHREMEAKRDEEERLATLERQSTFVKIRDEVASGRNLHALNTITHAYFGWYSDLDKEATPQQRVEDVVGKQNLEAAYTGLRAVRTRNDLPTVRAGAELRAQKSQTYFLERIAIGSCALQLAEGGDLSVLPRPLLESALAGLDWGLFSHEGKELADLEVKLQALVFDTPEHMESFIRDDLEPFLEAKTNIVSGISKVMHQPEFAELSAKLSVDWLSRFADVPPEILGYNLDAAVGRGDPKAVGDLIAERLAKREWASEEHRVLWYGAAFALDFARFEKELESFAAEKTSHMWAFQHADRRERYEVAIDPITDLPRLGFLLRHYARRFPLVELPGASWGSQSPYDGAQFVVSLLNRLAAIPTEDARGELMTLMADKKLGNHIDHAQHVFALQERLLAEISWGARTLADVRGILEGGPPGTVDDLQAFVMDELVMLQRELQDGTTEAVEPFWDGTKPHDENYCRHRIIDGIHHRLERRGVRALPEGAMPDNNRCDVLCVSDTMDLPIEVKGQWHSEVWNAASLQLEDNYVREYRAEGRGIFLVVWFGRLAGYNPPQLDGKAVPQTAQEMLELLQKLSPRPIDGKTKLFVLDVSRPARKQEQVEAKAKKAGKPKAKKKGT